MDTFPILMAKTSSTDLIPRSVLETLAYSDLFDHPLTIEELHRYLTVPAERADILPAIADLRGRVDESAGYFFLAGREEIVAVRREREARSRPLFEIAVRCGRLIGRMPFVRMCALTGSLAMLNTSKGADMDFMLVTAHGRLWTARAFAVLFGRLLRPFGRRVCVNLVISESSLAWPVTDLYSAREMCQMIPITGLDTYRRLRESNLWIQSVLPNAVGTPVVLSSPIVSDESAKSPARHLYGNRFEHWAMAIQMRRISRRPGFSDETVFNEDVCQANFDHHRALTRKKYEEKLIELGLGALLESALDQPVGARLSMRASASVSDRGVDE